MERSGQAKEGGTTAAQTWCEREGWQARKDAWRRGGSRLEFGGEMPKVPR